MRWILPITLALLPGLPGAAEFHPVSNVTAVTVYPSGAEVTREASVDLPAGQHELILADLPRTTPLGSVRVEAEGMVLGSVTTRQDYVPPRDAQETAELAAARAEVDRLESRLREGEADVAAIRLEAEAARGQVDFLENLSANDGLAGLKAGALRDLARVIGAEGLAARRTAHDAERRAKTADRALDDLRAELKAARQAVEALVPETGPRAMLAVSVSAETPVSAQMRVRYVMNRAGWQPVHDFRLARDAARVDIARGALVRQATGENWRDVAMTLSTVRPAERSAPSDIQPWLRRIVDPEKSRQKGAMPAVGAGFAGRVAGVMPEAAAKTATAEFDGLAVTYSYPDPVSVATGADRVRLALGTQEVAADLVAQAVPLRDSRAYLMARITNDTGTPLLRTREARFYRDGRFVGQRALDTIPAGGDAALAFGPVDGLRLTRLVPERSAGDRGVLSKSNALLESVSIEVENLTGESWPLRVLDRVPYSEQEDLQVDWQADPRPDTQDVDGKRGVLAWEFDLPPGATRAIRLDYDLRWPEGMDLR